MAAAWGVRIPASEKGSRQLRGRTIGSHHPFFPVLFLILIVILIVILIPIFLLLRISTTHYGTVYEDGV